MLLYILYAFQLKLISTVEYDEKHFQDFCTDCGHVFLENGVPGKMKISGIGAGTSELNICMLNGKFARTLTGSTEVLRDGKIPGVTILPRAFICTLSPTPGETGKPARP